MCGALVIQLRFLQTTQSKTNQQRQGLIFFGLYASHPHSVTAEAQLDLPFGQGIVQSDGPA